MDNLLIFNSSQTLNGYLAVPSVQFADKRTRDTITPEEFYTPRHVS